MEIHTQTQEITNTISIYTMTSFGAKLRKWRKAKGMTQVELAEASGCNESWISNLERGFSATKRDGVAKPSEELVVRFAKVLGVDTDEMLLAAGYAPKDEVIPLSIITIGFEGLNETDINEIAAFIKFKKEQRHMADHPEIQPLDEETLRRGGHLSRKPILIDAPEDEAKKKKTSPD